MIGGVAIASITPGVVVYGQTGNLALSAGTTILSGAFETAVVGHILSKLDEEGRTARGRAQRLADDFVERSLDKYGQLVTFQNRTRLL